MCPPIYQMSFEGLRDAWTVGLVYADGSHVPYKLERTSTRIVLTFRPAKDKFIDGRIGDYLLVFQMGPKGAPGVRYQIKTDLKTNVQKPPKSARPE
jgi:hypothetical protein